MANEIGYASASPTGEDQNDLSGVNAGVSHNNATYRYTASSGDTVTNVKFKGRRSVANNGVCVVGLRNTTTNVITHAVTIGPGLSSTQHTLVQQSVSWTLVAGVTYALFVTPTTADIFLSFDTGAAGEKSTGSQSTVSATWSNTTGGYKDTARFVLSADVTAGGGGDDLMGQAIL